MKSPLLLGIVLLSWTMFGTIYSQNLTDYNKDRISKVHEELTMANGYFIAWKVDKKNYDDKAIEHYEKAAKMMQILPHSCIVENKFDEAYLNLGNLYSIDGNHNKSLDYYCKFFNYAQRKDIEDVILRENLYVRNAESGWLPIGVGKVKNWAIEDNQGTVNFYNAQKLKRKNGIIKVWIKNEDMGKATPITQSEMKGSFKYSDDKSTKYLNEILEVRYPYAIKLEEFDCNKQRFRILQGVWYDEEGTQIDSLNDNNAQWEDVIPNSIGEKILEFLCN